MTVELPKWPRLLVTGEPVTREQANEILVRTASWPLWINDKQFMHAVNALAGEFGMPAEPDWSEPGVFIDHTRKMEEWRDSLGILDHQYLHNSRIASAYIGGPHGWCDWDGRIGCAGYEVGKWPSVDELTLEWQEIAAAFPYLKLHAQVLSEKDWEDPSAPVVVLATWAVTGGKAALVEPVEQIAPWKDLTEETVLGRVLGPGGEHGVTLERLREALEQVAGSAR